MSPLIKFHNFSFRYKGNTEYAIKDINIEINRNKFILLCGETGSGKTTLIRTLNGLIPQFYAGYYKGYVEVNGKNTEEISIADLSTEVGIVFQNPENQLIAMNVEHEIVFGLENLGFPPEEISKRLKESVEITQISHLLDKPPFELSGGEQQRVAIASIIALEPDILVLDEPTSLLDPFMAKRILELLHDIQKKKEMTVIISEHRMDLVLPYADEILLMKDALVVEHGKTQQIINGKKFQQAQINHPKIYLIFKHIKEKYGYPKTLPGSISEAINYLKTTDHSNNL
ncbi:MAG: energy-coupling factor ABC transporter ATP-binding protein [Promethearchaeia archaeon]